MTKNALLSTDRKGIEIWEALKKSEIYVKIMKRERSLGYA
jgi:hypothetical protein